MFVVRALSETKGNACARGLNSELLSDILVINHMKVDNSSAQRFSFFDLFANWIEIVDRVRDSQIATDNHHNRQLIWIFRFCCDTSAEHKQLNYLIRKNTSLKEYSLMEDIFAAHLWS